MNNTLAAVLDKLYYDVRHIASLLSRLLIFISQCKSEILDAT